jgi:hypothetical protein
MRSIEVIGGQITPKKRELTQRNEYIHYFESLSMIDLISNINNAGIKEGRE